MREIRQSGSEGGAEQTNAPFLPLSIVSFAPLQEQRDLLAGAVHAFDEDAFVIGGF